MTVPILIAISIGPIQDFIQNSRRLRDLEYSSWLLSELSKAGAAALPKDGLIFPSPDADLSPNSPTTVANKLLATIATDGAITTLMPQVTKAIQDRLKELWKEVGSRYFDSSHLELANWQICDFVEITWAAVPIVANDYAVARKQVEGLLASRKMTRTFSQSTRRESLPKSSLDGHRESVITRGDTSQTYGIGKGEELSAVDLLKRLGKKAGERSQFLTTSHVAALPLLERLARHNSTEIVTAWEAYRKAMQVSQLRDTWNYERVDGEYDARTFAGRLEQIFKQRIAVPFWGDVDGTLFYPERVGGDSKDRQDPVVKEARRALAAFYEQVAIVTNGIREPQPYYAILVADGDSMGKAIDHQAQSKDGITQHRALSQALDRFANEAKTIIKKDLGAPIYTGGDDVLAFLPVHTVVACAAALAKKFRTLLKPFKDDIGAAPTLSVGVAIVHYLMPLSDALEIARSGEKTAKKFTSKSIVEGKVVQYKKNALAVAVSKRSGSVTTVCGHWQTDTLADGIDSRLHQFVRWHREGHIPDGFAYELRDLVQRLHGSEHGTIFQHETQRIAKRKEMDELVLRDILAMTAASNVEDSEETIRQLADEIIVARILADTLDMAGRPMEDQ